MNLEGAMGYLVGEPHKGMKGMFVMMNHARLGVGLKELSGNCLPDGGCFLPRSAARAISQHREE